MRVIDLRRRVFLVLVSIFYFIICLILKNNAEIPMPVLAVAPVLSLGVLIFAPWIFPLDRYKWLSYLLSHLFAVFIAGSAIAASNFNPALTKAFEIVTLIALILGLALLVWYNFSTKSLEAGRIRRYALVFLIGAWMVSFFVTQAH